MVENGTSICFPTIHYAPSCWLAAATSDDACRTTCFDASKEEKAPCVEMDSDCEDSLDAREVDCEPVMHASMWRPQQRQTTVVLEQKDGEPR
jgi:hypothetical protein